MSQGPLSSRFPRAFVTGASSGLGEAFVRMLLAEGIEVWGTSRDLKRLAFFDAQPRFHPVALELGNEAGCIAAFRHALADTGGAGFDLVILNAGYGVFAPFELEDFAVWRRQLEAMVLGTAALSHEAFRALRLRGAGMLVQVSSLATEFPLPCMSAYNMSKAALSALSETLMLEARGTGVRVVDFRPGDYASSFNQAMQPSPAVLADARLKRLWACNDAHVRSAPRPERAAHDLRKALLRGRSGVLRSGSFFQARLAALFAKFAPEALRRAVAARYFGSS